METNKRRIGDRKDGYWLRDLDALHVFTPYLMPDRADNEAFVQERIDLTNLEAYLAKKNAMAPEYEYKLFHVVVAAIVKTVILRPKLNYFIQGNRMYRRNELTTSFVVKKEFKDNSHEALAYISYEPDCTIDSVHDRIMSEIHNCRSDALDNSTAGMDMLGKLPRWVLHIVIGILHRLDYYGRVPLSLVKTDPNYATIFISNLGSIKLNAGYHHLNNWGTNSLFLVIGKKHMAPVFDESGNYTMHSVLEMGFTLDERIADGYYYSRSIALFKHLLQNPELLELSANTEVEYE
ncbi:MAG: 2-oxo acid dehydrogenase subunit E2 [Clostridia bacterium]